MKMNATVRTLDDDYELNQLVPEYKNPTEKKTKLEKAIDNIPATTSMRMRMAVFEAIVDEVIEEELLDEDGNQVKSSEIEEKVLETVDKAVDLHLVPSSVRNHIPQLIARHMKYIDPRMKLVSKAAHFLTGNMVRMEESDTVVSHLIEDKEVVEEALGSEKTDGGIDVVTETVVYTGDNAQTEGSVPINQFKNKRFNYRMENGKIVVERVEPDDPIVEDALDTKNADIGVDVTKEVIEFEGDNAQTDGTTPTIVDKSMKYLAVSAVNHRKATAAVARNISSHLLVEMLHDLRNVLPAKFKSKFNVK